MITGGSQIYLQGQTTLGVGTWGTDIYVGGPGIEYYYINLNWTEP
ncbi:MAG: hypothetical protein R2827_08625 [Bdellovibrionales bacterium]